MQTGHLAVEHGSARPSRVHRHLKRGVVSPGMRLTPVLHERLGPIPDWLNEELLETIAHEFRTPLTVVKGFLAVLLASGEALSPDQRLSTLRMMQANVDDLHAMVENLIAGISLQLPERAETPRPVNISVAVAEAAEKVGSRRRLEHAGVALAVDLPVVLGPVWGHHRYIRELAVQAIANAVKYSRPGSRVKVSGRNGFNFCELKVEDEGMGVSPDGLHRVLDAFSRHDAAYESGAAGTGLGLYIAKRIVRRYRGTMSLSRNEAGGTTLTIRLPRGGASIVPKANGACYR